MTEKRRLHELSTQIKQVEKRIDELKTALKNESDVVHKLTMQSSYKANQNLLKTLKEQFWNESGADMTIKSKYRGL